MNRPCHLHFDSTLCVPREERHADRGSAGASLAPRVASWILTMAARASRGRLRLGALCLSWVSSSYVYLTSTLVSSALLSPCSSCVTFSASTPTFIMGLRALTRRSIAAWRYSSRLCPAFENTPGWRLDLLELLRTWLDTSLGLRRRSQNSSRSRPPTRSAQWLFHRRSSTRPISFAARGWLMHENMGVPSMELLLGANPHESSSSFLPAGFSRM
mmetsp:Transcript_9467/g.35448  ORF Transcript_9467/g.35448 Transcript_9467/m.35448 type:complete len:215 (+) Transcript_9467:2-646(+)